MRVHGLVLVTMVVTSVSCLADVSLHGEYAHDLHVSFESTHPQPCLFLPIPTDCAGLAVASEADGLRIAGDTACSEEGQTGLNTAFEFDASSSFEIAVLFTLYTPTSSFVLEVHDCTPVGRYHLTLTTSCEQSGAWWCWFGDDTPNDCQHLAGSPLELDETFPRTHTARLGFDANSGRFRAFLDSRLIGQTLAPAPLGLAIVRCLVSSGPGPGESNDTLLRELAFGWDGEGQHTCEE